MTAASEASLLLFGLIIAILSFDFNEPQDCKKWEIIQFIILVTFMAVWAYVTMGLNKPTAQEEAFKTQKLNEAIPMAGNSGVSQEWYNNCNQLLNKIGIFVMTWIVCAIFHLVVISYPYSIWQWLANSIQNGWICIVNHYSHKTIFVLGVWGAEFCTYWIVGLLYAILDLTRPSIISPFKVQENFVLTKEDFFTCCKVGMRNQIICLIFIYFLWDIYPLLSPQGFDVKIPSLIEIIISIIIFLPFTEIWFYSTHIMLHKSDWLWSHIHYVHHEWTSPIALNCIYAHWSEFVGVNVIMLLLGPFVMGSHVIIWIIWSIGGMISTLHGHSGWHLPFGPAPEAHDYHHLTGEQNYGTLGILDTFFGTNVTYLLQAWQAEVDHKYKDTMYPVDKILAMNGINPNIDPNENNSKNPTHEPFYMLEIGKKQMPMNANYFGVIEKKQVTVDNNSGSDESGSDSEDDVGIDSITPQQYYHEDDENEEIVAEEEISSDSGDYMDIDTNDMEDINKFLKKFN